MGQKRPPHPLQGPSPKVVKRAESGVQGPFNQNIKGQNMGQKRPPHPLQGPSPKVVKRAETGVQGKGAYQPGVLSKKQAKREAHKVFIANKPITNIPKDTGKGSYVPPSLRPKKAAKNNAPKVIENKQNTNAPKEKVPVATNYQETKKPTVTQATIENTTAVKEKEKEAPTAVKGTTTPAVEVEKPSEQKIADIKVLTVAQINEQTDKEVSQETKTDEKDKTSGGHFELNALMSNILKEEIRDIMDKVWGCLLDQPETAPAVFAADMIRNVVAPHIGTAIGLNVTKRLLNVFNPMFAKIQFSCRPENGCLTAFLQKYNIKNFKRIDSSEYTFAAQLEDVADFDALCYTSGLKCGSADLKITPCYKYTQCPANLRLNLDEDEETQMSDDSMFDVMNDDNEPIFTESVKTAKQVVKEKEEVPANIENKTKDKNDEKQTKRATEENKSTVTNSSPKNDMDKVTDKLKSIPKANKKSVDKEKTSQNDTAGVSPKKLSMNTFEVIDEAYEDEEEVDDANISELLSGGVVLDECGSDD